MSSAVAACRAAWCISIPKGAIMRGIDRACERIVIISIPKGAIMSFNLYYLFVSQVHNFNSKRCDYEPAAAGLISVVGNFNSKRCDYEAYCCNVSVHIAYNFNSKRCDYEVRSLARSRELGVFQFQKVRL